MESELGRKIQVALCKIGARVWRNNVALAWTGDEIIHCGRDVIIKNARPIHAGLCDGSSDYIGIYTGKFLAVEIKTQRGRLTDEQGDFIDMINQNGGLAFVARSEEEAIKKLTGGQ